MEAQKWCDNVILVDADYVDKVAFDLIVNFERMIGRQIPQADMALWLECIALDGGLLPIGKQHVASDNKQKTQVVLLHKQQAMKNFQPGRFEELDGQAFSGELGEMLISCVKVEEVTTMEQLFTESLQVIGNAKEVKRLMAVPDSDHIYNKVREALRYANPDQHITIFNMQPMSGGSFRQEILGYSLMAALGIKAEEIKE
ncbi:MAG: hypothetical protein J1E37_05310 [Prevotella sp.]|nr:hypothetical protein [Prevotella sp.]